MKNISPFRFCLWMLIFTAGCVFIILKWNGLAIVALCFSSLALFDRREISRQAAAQFPNRKVLLPIILLVALNFAFSHYWNFSDLISNPLVVTPLWIFSIANTFRIWKRDNKPNGGMAKGLIA